MAATTRGRRRAPDAEPRSGGTVVARVGASLALLAGAYLVLKPFLVPMVWAAIAVTMSWPLYRRARDWTQRPASMAALFVLAAVFGLVIPIAWLLAALAEQAPPLVRAAQDWLEAGAPLPHWLVDIRWFGARLVDLRDHALAASGEVTAYLRGHAGALSQYAVGLAGGLARNLFACSVALLAMFTFYVNGDSLTARARTLAAAAVPGASARLLDDVGSVLQAVVFGLVGTAIAQGILAGVGLALFGIPSPVALGAATTLLSFLPGGSAVPWLGGVVWLVAGGSKAAGIGLTLWGILLVSSVDNVLRPILIRRMGAANLPFLLTFFGVIGGLAAFGFLGLFLGPVLLSVVFTLLADYGAPPEPGEETKPRE